MGYKVKHSSSFHYLFKLFSSISFFFRIQLCFMFENLLNGPIELYRPRRYSYSNTIRRNIFVTTAPAPIVAPRPMVTPGITCTSRPNHTSSSTTTSASSFFEWSFSASVMVAQNRPIRRSCAPSRYVTPEQQPHAV